jgi:hypothetical protein
VVSSLGTVCKQRNNPDYAALAHPAPFLRCCSRTSSISKQISTCTSRCDSGRVICVGYVAYSWWASKNRHDNVHDAHLDGAFVGLVFVGLTDYEAWQRAFRLLFG